MLAFEISTKMSFRGERPSSVEDWDKVLADIDEKLLQQ